MPECHSHQWFLKMCIKSKLFLFNEFLKGSVSQKEGDRDRPLADPLTKQLWEPGLALASWNKNQELYLQLPGKGPGTSIWKWYFCIMQLCWTNLYILILCVHVCAHMCNCVKCSAIFYIKVFLFEKCFIISTYHDRTKRKGALTSSIFKEIDFSVFYLRVET